MPAMSGHPSSRPSYDEARAAIGSVPSWYHQIEVLPGLVTPGIHNSRQVLPHLGLPEDCSGMRVLDIGARDGFFSFELERRGADVTAFDYVPAEQTGFAAASRLLRSQVEYVVGNVYDLSRERLGAFDLVLFLGVLYHLRDPLLALDRIWDVCRDRLVVETQTLDEAFVDPVGGTRRLVEVAPGLSEAAIAQFYPHELDGDETSWWSPNATCLRALLTAAGFEVDHQVTLGPRGIARAGKTLDPVRLHYRQIDRTVFTSERTFAEAPDWLVDKVELFEPAERERALERGRSEQLARARSDRDEARAELDSARRQLDELRRSRLFRYSAPARRTWYRVRALPSRRR